ncbi:hypothetical protein LBMAG56_50990 [Verrucomicrobiota bacterium]|nr:hypothetical protein LBMAG56_50990 [Verrucomicrobiota bacterium]
MASKPPTPPPAAAATGAAAAGAATPAKASALAAWLPLIVTLTLMPVLAWATMHFLVLPKLQKALAKPAVEEATDATDDAHGDKSEKSDKTDSHGKPAKADAHGKSDKPEKSAAAKKNDAKAKVLAPLSKVLVNVFGTGGARYLIVSMTLVGNTPEFKTKVEENKDQLLDAAASTLASKSISDLERLGIRNQIRAELVTVFNTVLKATPVQEIYLTEFAVQ